MSEEERIIKELDKAIKKAYSESEGLDWNRISRWVRNEMDDYDHLNKMIA